jgi:hypothetical protein
MLVESELLGNVYFTASSRKIPQIMESVNYKRPHRAIIRCKAKIQLLQIAADFGQWFEPVDETLLKELAANLFRSAQYQMLYELCQSKQDANYADDKLVGELVETYRQISQRRRDSIVQGLNALL